MNTSNNQRSSLYILISVFFFWGFVAASNTILIPVFKKNFQLEQWQSQLVDLAFYAAYFSGSLIYFLVSVSGRDPLNRIGYKKGLIYGLIISALGALGFVPAATAGSFGLMLASLFIVGLGFSLQQIVANPYVIALGEPAKGSHRISLAGGINSIGTTIGPLLLAYAMFGSINYDSGASGLDMVKTPYTLLAISFLLFALLLGLSRLPAISNPEALEKDMGALKYPQLKLGMLAIFAYVGVEVSIQSNLPALMEQPGILGLDHTQTVHFISMYWGSLMVGRWMQAVSVFDLSAGSKKLLTVLAPLLAFALVMLVNKMNGRPMADFIMYMPFLALLIVIYMLGAEKPARTLLLFSVAGVVMMLVGLVSTGSLALYAFISGGLFCSIMWPCIFSLSIAGLGKYTNQGSALLIMMILGGALIPPLQGYLADRIGIHLSYIIPVLCFAYLAFYAWKVKAELKKQGIDYETQVAQSH